MTRVTSVAEAHTQASPKSKTPFMCFIFYLFTFSLWNTVFHLLQIYLCEIQLLMYDSFLQITFMSLNVDSTYVNYVVHSLHYHQWSPKSQKFVDQTFVFLYLHFPSSFMKLQSIIIVFSHAVGGESERVTWLRKHNLRKQEEVQVKGFAKGPSLLTTISDTQL